MSRLEVREVSKIYPSPEGDVAALDAVSLYIETGELLVLLGPSGCGKTLLRSIAGLERPTGGRIAVGGAEFFAAESRVNLPSRERNIGFVFQNYSLWPHMTVAQNVAYPLRARKLPRHGQTGAVADVLKLVQCESLADRRPAQLSGGQQQRVALARAMVARPTVMLFDEPLSNLDAVLKDDLRSEIRRMHRELGFTGVYVTHDQEEAMELASRIAVMNAGRVEQIGSPQDVFENPLTEYVAHFLGATNRLPFGLTPEGWRGAFSVPPSLSERLDALGVEEVAVRVRPSSVEARPEPGDSSGCLSAQGTVVDVAYRGSEKDIVCAVGELDVRGRSYRRNESIEVGASVHLSIEPGDVHAYVGTRA